MKTIKLICIFIGLFLLTAFPPMSRADAAGTGTAGTYAVMKLTGTVSPVMADYLEESIAKANGNGAKFIVIQMDTPGGLLDSTRAINQTILRSKIPVVVYVYPGGAQAASAGGFIMLASHVAAMAPGTEVGAMHPVAPMLDFMKKDDKGEPAGVMEKKVLNDTVAYARSLAQKRNRNVDWTERAVREAVSATYQEALRLRFIEIVAADMDDLLRQMDNRRIHMDGGEVRIRTAGLTRVDYDMTRLQSMLSAMAVPQVILLLLVLAIAGIGIEIKNPGMIVPGVVGGLSLILFLLIVRIIPINIAGVAFIVLAVVLFILELKLTSYGLLTIGGIASFIFGASILFPGGLEGWRVPLISILATLMVILAFVFLVLRAVLAAHRAPVSTGLDGLAGERGEAIRAFSGMGKVMVHGEIWVAESDEPIQEKEPVRVISAKGMVLKVEKYNR